MRSLGSASSKKRRSLSKESIVELAPAKINLYLHILGKRDDGYHEVDSLIGFVDWGDLITVIPHPPYQLLVSGDCGLEAADNLAWKAALSLAEKVSRPLEAQIHLQKLLPTASGLGGGTSDAIACLRALQALWKIPDTDPALLSTVQEIGADGMACFTGVSCFVSGRGDRIDPAPPLPLCSIVLVNPNIALLTSQVFAERHRYSSSRGRFTAEPQDVYELVDILRQRSNDLTQRAIQKVPCIAEILDFLENSPGCLLARMSGSGATCFGLYKDALSAYNAMFHGKTFYPRWWIVNATLLSCGKES